MLSQFKQQLELSRTVSEESPKATSRKWSQQNKQGNQIQIAIDQIEKVNIKISHHHN